VHWHVPANSFNAFLCWFKLIQFLSYVPRFGLVTGTLANAAKGVRSVAIVCTVCLITLTLMLFVTLSVGSLLSLRSVCKFAFRLACLVVCMMQPAGG